jgi:uncharacterized membrane protein
MNRRLLQWLLPAAVVTVGTFAGVLFAASLAISPSLKLLDATHYVTTKQAQIRILQVSMTIISSIYTVVAAAILVVQRKERSGWLFRLTLASLVLIIGALVYSGPTDISYNQQILSWDPAAPPAIWSTVRDQWDLANRIRTVPAMLAFILQAVSLLYK